MTIKKKPIGLHFKIQTSTTSSFRLIVLVSLLGVSTVHAQVSTLLMTPEQRQSIDAERQAYLTQPTDKQVKKTPTKRESPGLVQQEKTLLVSAILKSNGNKQVQINGAIYKESESKQGIQVHRIGNQTITLTANGKWGRAKVGVLYDLNDWPKSPESVIRTGPLGSEFKLMD